MFGETIKNYLEEHGIKQTFIAEKNGNSIELFCMILKNILEEQEEKIFNEMDENKYKSKGFESTSVHTIMGNVP